MNSDAQTTTNATGKKAAGGKTGKKNSRHKQQKHHRDTSGGSTSDLSQQQTQSRVPPTGNEPDSDSNGVEQHLGCSTCVVEIPCGASMCCLAKLACQRLESGANVCNSLEDYSKRAKELKDDISSSLEKKASNLTTDQPTEVIKLKDDIHKLSLLYGDETVSTEESTSNSQPDDQKTEQQEAHNIEPNDQFAFSSGDLSNVKSDQQPAVEEQNIITHDIGNTSSHKMNELKQEQIIKNRETSSSTVLGVESNKSEQEQDKSGTDVAHLKSQKWMPMNETKSITSEKQVMNTQNEQTTLKNELDTLNNVNLDVESKYLAIISALKPHFKEAPHLLEPISHKLASMSDDYRQLAIESERQRLDNQRLEKMKQKLESLCRELQKSNNAIRNESLDLIKVEQGKTKEQNTKIQSTLSGVIKLFDENQQRNMSLRQENQELQMKLKSLLDHCDNWERSVETAMKQRDIENRLIRTELAKANLLKTEEKEKFLTEKQELLQILSMMQEQQHKIEGQEAKLRSDLSSYASKYDECQAVISKGMSRFQLESKKMLQQIEMSKKDYKVLLSKYESSNRRMVQLLEEKKCWDKAMTLANKKIDTLEKLCRALSGRKLENGNNDQIDMTKPGQNKNKNKAPRDAKSQTGNASNQKKPVINTASSVELEMPGNSREDEDQVKETLAESIEVNEKVSQKEIQSGLNIKTELLTETS